jgi:hypothetical protein
MAENNEFDRTGKQVVVLYSKSLSWYLHEGTEENQDGKCPNQDSNWAFPKYYSDAFATCANLFTSQVVRE